MFSALRTLTVFACLTSQLSSYRVAMTESGPDRVVDDFDERPAAMLQHELRFNYFTTLLTTAITLVGGAVVLKGALVPEAAYRTNFVAGIVALVIGGLFAFEGQNVVLKRLQGREQRESAYAQFVGYAAAGGIFLGLGLLIAYFMTNVQR